MKKYSAILILTIIFLSACEDPNALPSGKLTGGIWMCNSQLSESYQANNITVNVSLKFTGDKGNGNVEVYEGNGLSKSCVCNGSYSLGSDRKSLEISGLYNDNCLWMNKLNGNYVYSKDDRMLCFNNGSIKIATLK